MKTLKLASAMRAMFIWGGLCGLVLAQPPAQEKVVTPATKIADEATSTTTDGSSAPLIAQDDIPEVTAERPMSFWMARKLEYSKSILEALTAGDFDILAADAKRMRTLGRIEGLVRRKNESYRDQLRAFDLATQELGRQASRKNAEGAALAFNQLTNSCVSCHVLLREGVD